MRIWHNLSPPDGRRRFIYWIGLFYLLVLIYAASFRSPFLYDDIPSILQNPDMQSSDGWKRIFESHETSLDFDRRPVGALLTWFNYQISGTSVFGYHVVNLLIHWMCAIFLGEVIVLACAFLKKSASSWFAIGAATVWAVHPLNSMAVIYIYQRMELLMAFFALLSIWARLLYHKDSDRSSQWALVSGVCVLLSIGSKEGGVVVIVLLMMIDYAIIKREHGFVETLASGWRFYSILGICILPMLVWILSGTRVDELDTGNVLSRPFEYFKSQCRVVVHYLFLCVWPKDLVFHYTNRHIGGWADWWPQLIFLSGLNIVAIAFARFKRWATVLVIGVFVVLAPTSSFIPLLESSMEYRMYLPSAGIVVLLLITGRWIVGRFAWLPSKFKVLCLICLVMVLSGITMRRTIDYRSTVALWSDVVEKQPMNLKARAILGSSLMEEGRLGEARLCAQELLWLGKELPSRFGQLTALRILVNLALEDGNPAEAIEVAKQVLEIDSSAQGARQDLGLALTRNGEVELGLRMIEEELSRFPPNGNVLAAYAEALIASGRIDEADSLLSREKHRYPFNVRLNRVLQRIDAMIVAGEHHP